MELNKWYNRYRFDRDYNVQGVDVVEEDWDTLIILDSCRYDVFRSRHSLSGRLESRISRGGDTREFLRGNFRGRDFLDTVYVTANPQFYRYQEDLETRFHAVRNVWKDGWDDQLQTVHPETTTAAGERAIEEFPHKRIVIHYNQPHGPYLGPTGDRLFFGAGNVPPGDRSYLDDLVISLKRELVSTKDHRSAYIENFDIVHPYVEELLDELGGRSVVTADHGQMLGERATPIPVRYYTHRGGTYVEEMVKVPWLIHESGNRRSIRAEETKERSEEIAAEVVQERLHDLGYTE